MNGYQQGFVTAFVKTAQSSPGIWGALKERIVRMLRGNKTKLRDFAPGDVADHLKRKGFAVHNPRGEGFGQDLLSVIERNPKAVAGTALGVGVPAGALLSSSMSPAQQPVYDPYQQDPNYDMG